MQPKLVAAAERPLKRLFSLRTGKPSSVTLMSTTIGMRSAEALLEERRRSLLVTTDNLRQPAQEAIETWSEEVDLAQAAAERDTSEALRHCFDELQDGVERALARLEAGSYGICEDCAEPISPERLQILPEATRCVECQRSQGCSPVPAIGRRS
jgi:DnaK suppressor protein